MKGIIRILVIIAFFIIITFYIKNKKSIEEFFKTKRGKIINRIIGIVFIIFYVWFAFSTVKSLFIGIKYYEDYNKNEKMFERVDELILKERDYYDNTISQNYEKKYKEPYLLNGFKHVEGEWNTGYVVEDEKGNQFVWVPTCNEENDEAVKLIKKDFKDDAVIQATYCNDENYEKFIKSALENGGFYVSRYEIGLENDKVISKAQTSLLKNITKEEMIKKISDSFVNTDYKCELINSYAYDTMIDWILKDQKVETNILNIKEIYNNALSGRIQHKNIYDTFDNVFELTSEMNYEVPVMRGFVKKDLKKDDYRYTFDLDGIYDDTIISSRLVLYK